MIIVEGMDNTGKTTLIAQLAEDLKLTAVKTYKKPQCSEDVVRYTRAMDLLDRNLDGKIILDRIPSISEPIYGPICRGSSFVEPEHLDYCHRIEKMAKALVVYCRPSAGAVFNFGDRPQMDGVKEQRVKLLREYDSQINELKKYLPVCLYDYETHSYESLKLIVENHLGGPVQ